jgi:hypothetical protein
MAGWQQKDTHHTVSADILNALGKGCLIATGGLIAGILLGTANPALLSLFTVAIAAVSGVGCIIGSAVVRNAGFDVCEQDVERSTPEVRVGKSMAESPTLGEGLDGAAEDWGARRRVMASRERGHGTNRTI